MDAPLIVLAYTRVRHYGLFVLGDDAGDEVGAPVWEPFPAAKIRIFSDTAKNT